MVRVVGQDPRVLKQVTCRHCAAVLEYTPHELKRHEGRDYSGGVDIREWIVCPRCGHEVTVNHW
jgi:RNase P subunit RPR2